METQAVCEKCGEPCSMYYPLVNQSVHETGELRESPMVHPSGCPPKMIVLVYDPGEFDSKKRVRRGKER